MIMTLVYQVFPLDTPEGQKRKERLHDRVGEHNVRMIAQYYTRVSFQRMAQLLEFSVEVRKVINGPLINGDQWTFVVINLILKLFPPLFQQMEEFVCKLIVEGIIPEGKIHRPSQIIYLSAKKSNIEVLDQVSTIHNF
jgi:hypothetical protein